MRISRTAVFKDEEVKPEGEHVDNQWDDNEASDSEADMCCKLNLGCCQRSSCLSSCFSSYLGHLDVSKLVPQVLDRVQANQCRAKHSNPFDTANTADGNSTQHKPDHPFKGKGLLLQTVKSGPAKNRRKGEEQEHRVQKDESADCSVRILEKDCQSHEPDSGTTEIELLCGIVCQWYAQRTECSIELSHELVVEVFWVGLTRLELERAIVTGKVSGQANQHLSKRRVYIKVEFAFEVVGSKLAKAREARVSARRLAEDGDGRKSYCASSQVTIGERSIFHMRVKKARAMKRMGATIGSSLSNVLTACLTCERLSDSKWPLRCAMLSKGYDTCSFFLSSSSIGRALPFCCVEGTFRLLKSSD